MSLSRVATLLVMSGIALSAVRSFGEQVKHVACAQFAFFNEFGARNPAGEKGGHDPAKTKAELIKSL